MATSSLEKLRDLFYRCRNQEVLAATENFAGVSETDPFGNGHVRAAAFFELHQVAEAEKIYAFLSENANSKGDMAYAQGRLAYLLSDYGTAEAAFQASADLASNSRQKFVAILGLANVAYSQNQHSKVPVFIEALSLMAPELADDDRISFLLLRANHELESGMALTYARHSYYEALKLASARGWNFFINRIFYGLALVEQKGGLYVELESTLNILRAMVDPQESSYFIHLVNDSFKDSPFQIGLPIAIDDQNMEIQIQDRRVSLAEKPLLFQFLKAIQGQRGFVSKMTLATRLWPSELYHPVIHDARIFDIVKRTRQLLEKYDQQPVVILSGRMGYKLASQQ